VLTVLSSTIKYNEYATDKGGNVSIPCIAQGNIMWVKEHGNNSTIIQVSCWRYRSEEHALSNTIYPFPKDWSCFGAAQCEHYGCGNLRMLRLSATPIDNNSNISNYLTAKSAGERNASSGG